MNDACIEKTKIIPKGMIFTVTEGEYSDYCTMALCKALIDIDVAAMQVEYINEHPEQGGDYQLNEDQFLAWMINKKQYAEEIQFHELHLGDYGTADFKVG